MIILGFGLYIGMMAMGIYLLYCTSGQGKRNESGKNTKKSSAR